MSSDLQQLQSIISDTKKLIDLAENNDWNAVIELDKKRNTDIQQLFESPPNIEAPVLAEGLQLILEKNKTLTKYSLSQVDSIRMEMSKAGHAHEAINAYLTTA